MFGFLVSQLKRKQRRIFKKNNTRIPKAHYLASWTSVTGKKKRHLIPLVHSSCASAPRKRQQRGRKDLTIQGAQEGVSLKNLVEDPFLWVNRKIAHLYGSQLGSTFHILDGTNTELGGSLFIQWFIYNVLYPVWFKENHRTNEIIINLEGFQPLAVGFQRDGNLSQQTWCGYHIVSFL